MQNVYAHMFLYPLRKQIEICKKHNLNCLLSLTASNIENFGIENFHLENDLKLGLHAPPHDMYLGSIDPRIRTVVQFRLEQTVNLAEKLHATHIVVHMNYIEEFHKYYIAQWIENAMELLDIFSNRNVIIHIENSIERSSDIFKKFFSELTIPHIKFCLDIGHVIAYSKDPLEKWILALAEHIGEIHLHETTKGEDKHLPLGSGLINWDKIFTLLEDTGVNLNQILLTLEPRNENDLKKSIEYLKTLL